jgi:hypothetical protein
MDKRPFSKILERAQRQMGVLRVNITAISKHSAAIKAKDGCSNQALASKGLYGSARP